jgi:6-phosphogluconolactonase (cycloisomerase 2 family)
MPALWQNRNSQPGKTSSDSTECLSLPWSQDWYGIGGFSLMKMRLMSAVFLAITLSGCGSSDSSNSNTHPAYLTVPQANHVIGYRINDDSGKLSTMSGSPFGTGVSPSAVSVAPSRSFVYVTDSVDNDVVAYSADGNSGSLTEISPRTPAGTSPVAVVNDPSGAFLFVANQASNDVSAYAIGSGGKLTEVTGSPFRVGAAPSALAVSPSGKFLYVSNANSSSISAFAPGLGLFINNVNGNMATNMIASSRNTSL